MKTSRAKYKEISQSKPPVNSSSLVPFSIELSIMPVLSCGISYSEVFNTNLKHYAIRTWIISNPRILYFILRGIFLGLLLETNTLMTLHILPPFKCQVTCQMCSVVKFKKGGESPKGQFTVAKHGSPIPSTIGHKLELL
jgi:hypothetical protein